MISTGEEVALWLVDDRPARLVWGGRRWRVSDQPTPLHQRAEWLPPMLTHAPEPRIGWRFQATAVDDGESVVVDVVATEGGEWRIDRVYR
ncbi:hypothetical protein [Agromyces seonyuensis]|uniref:Uncharacterized protein n=1 Tax=Agromyces seonyuensis TaxID=2662446 RepID=A0A6I4NVW4_9MICO|nr:hypothetical protein [Agromyces seonyuensis]MWB98393.1 hypothetical protein [Agromyces seonyuensis]